MITPPTAVIGARIMMFSAMTSSIWTCCTSFVLRVMRDGVPNWFVSAWENASTLRKIEPRRSRPTDIAIFAPQ